MRVAVMKLSWPLLRQLLALPEDTCILNCRLSEEREDELEIKIMEDSLPETQPGERLPIATPCLSTVFGDRPSRTVFMGWGIRE